MTTAGPETRDTGAAGAPRDELRAELRAWCERLEGPLGRARAVLATLELAAVRAACERGIPHEGARAVMAALLPSRDGRAHATTGPAPHALRLSPEASRALGAIGALGDAYESLLAWRDAGARKKRGSYFTPAPVAARLVERAFSARAAPPEAPAVVVLDPAMGAGRLLLASLAHAPASAMHGIDRDPLAVFVARASLLLASPDGTEPSSVAGRLRVGDALAPGALGPLRADVVVGNPPWVAHAGRQSVALAPRVRSDLRARFAAFSGFPTTHGAFVELCARALAPGGVLALLLPAQVADLAGYGPTRAALTSAASLVPPLDLLGFGRFDGVTEPTLLLVARQDPAATASPSPWTLDEPAPSGALPAPRRARTDVALALSDRARAALARLAQLPRFDPGTFGEAGFQTAGALSRTHLAPRSARRAPRFSVALREGRDVEPFLAHPPSRALDPDPAALARAGTRLRDPSAYARASVLIRQTARHPIAAVHAPPAAFRNSLLAGYTDDPWALCALLNSALFRALHLSSQRDGRQAVFPQLKVAHLRALPAPPHGSDLGPLRDLALAAARAQRDRADAALPLAAALGRDQVPRALLAPEGDAVPARASSLARLARGLRADAAAAVARAYDRALCDSREAHARYREARRSLDARVFALYGFSDDERDGIAR